MKCRGCGEEIADGSKFCQHCGAEQQNKASKGGSGQEPKQEKTVVCPNCKEKLGGQSTFCFVCGYLLKKVCRKCGKFSPGKAALCQHCGQNTLLDPTTTKTIEKVVAPREVPLEQVFEISGITTTFLGGPGQNRILLVGQRLEFEEEVEPEDNGEFKFSFGICETGEFEFSLFAGVASAKVKVKVVPPVRGKFPSTFLPPGSMAITPVGARREKEFIRLCFNPECNVQMREYVQYCPSRDCYWSQELKFTFRGKVYDKFRCMTCQHEEGISPFFVRNGDDLFFRTPDHEKYQPNDHRGVIERARLYECSKCGGRELVLAEETFINKVSDVATSFMEVWGDRLAKAAGSFWTSAMDKRSKRVEKNKGGSKK